MKSKLVVPAKVTEAPVWSLVRIIALLRGASMLSRVMSMHFATAGEIWDHAVQRHGVAGVTEVKLEVALVKVVLVTWD